MDIFKKLPKDISCTIFKYMRQPYLDNIDLHNIVLQKRCVGCNLLIRRHLPGTTSRGIVFECHSCHRLLCKDCVFFGISTQDSISNKHTCEHNGVKLI